MSDNPTSPLLGGPSTEPNGRPRSQRSSASTRSKRSQKSSHSDESTPLLARGDSYRYGDEEPEEASSPAASSLQALQDGGSSGKSKSRIRLGSIFALTTLMLLVVVVLAFVFAAPAVVKEYAEGAAVFTPTDLSIDSFTASGVKARVQGNFVLDGSRVGNNAVRDLGRAATWIARAAETKPSKVQVYLPEYGNILFGDAEIPSIVVSIRNGEKTDIDFIADVEPGDVDGIRRIANDWIDGRLGQLRVMGKANVGLKSGIFSLGTQSISETITFKGKDIPTMPKYNITKFNVHEADLSDSEKAMAADVSIEVFNKYPITFTVPPLAFDILVPACTAEEPYILLANATTQSIEVKPQNFITVDARGLVRHLPETLISVCPDSNTSPLDSLLADFMNGVKTTVFVRGAQIPSPDTPSWISDLMKDVIVPVPFTGHSMDNLIQDFSMTNVHFGLPNPLADPNTPESQPKLSATIKVTANLPSEINFPVSVSKVRSLATVFYKKKQMGILDLHKWQKAKSKRVEPHGDHPPGLIVESTVKNAPLNITDDDVFTDVVQALLFGGENVVLGVEATVDIETSTVLGKLVIRDIPAKGVVPLKPVSLGDGVSSFAPKVDSLKIIETTKSSLTVEVRANITNPTNYSATVPYVDLHLLSNGTLLGHATGRNLHVVPGNNTNITVIAVWDPLDNSGHKGVNVSRALISRYISGRNTTLTLQTHDNTFPSDPQLGHALSKYKVELPAPKLVPPKNPNHPDDEPIDEDGPRFIDDATMHLFSSTATFTLLSPLPHTTIYITHINATALYNHTEIVGNITYDLPFAVPPGASTSPRLPVDWSLGSVGYDAVKQALGGTLKLDTRAVVGVKVGAWEEVVNFQGRGIGAHVQL